MKAFKFILLLFITSASLVFGQEKRYFFKHEFQPNSKYLIKKITDDFQYNGQYLQLSQA